MRSSFRELSIAQPIQYPTMQDFSSHQYILTIDLMDEKLNSLPLDIYTMNLLALEIKQSLHYLQCKLDYFSRCGIRLMGLINCIFQQFGINCHHLSKLVGCFRYCNGNWKKQLIRSISSINGDPKIQTVFYYKAQRNVYLLSMLRTSNTIIQKMLGRLMTRGYLNRKGKRYLQSKGVKKCYQQVYKKAMVILEEKQEQTYLKIYLINEFIKYILAYVNICLTLAQQLQVFHKFFIAVMYLCRIIKKFYCKTIINIVTNSLKLVKKGLEQYIKIFQRRGSNFNIKIQQIKLVIRLIDPQYSYNSQKLVNQNAFVIKLVDRILTNWKKIHLRSQKVKVQSNSKVSQQTTETKLIKKQYNNKVYNRLHTAKVSVLKIQMVKLNKSLSHLNRRKSVSKIPQKKILPKSSTAGLSLQPISNIKIRNQIEGKLQQYFQNMSYPNQSKSYSKDKKRVMSEKKEQQNLQQKELKLQDYAQYYNNRSRVIPNSNKIQLYQADKMVNYYRGKPKPRLQLII